MSTANTIGQFSRKLESMLKSFPHVLTECCSHHPDKSVHRGIRPAKKWMGQNLIYLNAGYDHVRLLSPWESHKSKLHC